MNLGLGLFVVSLSKMILELRKLLEWQGTIHFHILPFGSCPSKEVSPSKKKKRGK